MKTKTLWLSWLYLFGFCCVLGFIPEPPTFLKVLLVIAGIAFFIPGALLLSKGGPTNIRRVRLLSILSLVLTLITIILNFVSVMMKPIWGDIFYILMGILSTPMLCSQYWLISLFGWAFLMSASFFPKK